MSVKEAVRIAQNNNFMGLICRSRLLDMAPALIESIKVAGLVLVSDASDDAEGDPSDTAFPPSHGVPDGIDGVLKHDGLLRFNETIDL